MDSSRRLRVLFMCVFAAGLIAGLAACGGSPAEPSGSSGSGGSGTSGGSSSAPLSATIDGASFSAPNVAVFVRNGILSMSGAQLSGTTTTTLAFAAAASVGAQSVSAGSGVNSNLLILNGANASGWLATGTMGSGTVNVQTLTASSASGTFSFNLPAANGGATGTKVVTNGRFNVTF